MKKTNFLIIGMILFGIAIILYGGYIIYGKIKPSNDDKKKEETILTLNEELKNSTLFSLKRVQNNLSLVALNTNGEETLIYDFNDYGRIVESVKYFYDSTKCKMYLSIKSNDDKDNIKFNIAEIDLTTNNYKLKNIKQIIFDRADFDKMDSFSIVKLGNNIYLANSELYKMDIEEKEIEKMDISSEERRIKLLGYNDNTLIYNIDDEIYKLDVSNNNNEKIIDKGILGYIYNNMIIYVDNTNGRYISKSYNLDNNEVKQISEDIGHALTDFDFTVPYKDSYVTLIFDTFYYGDNKSIQLTCENVNIDGCGIVSVGKYAVCNDNLNVTGFTSDSNLKFQAFALNIDLNTQEIKSLKKLDDIYEYLYVTYIK
jgi:hypothetical protein